MNKKHQYLCRTLLVCASLGLCSAAWADVVKTNASKLERATLFLQGAELTHTATARLSKGENELEIRGLSPEIDKSSLRIKTSAGIVIASYEVSTDYLTGANASPRAKQLQDSIDACNKHIQTLGYEKKINDAAIELFKAGVQKNVAQSDKGLSFDELTRTIASYKTKAAELEATSLQIAKRQEEAQKQLQRLSKQLQEEASRNSHGIGVLKLMLNANNAGNGKFEISYFTPSAGWVPYYDLNVTSVNAPIQLISKAKMAQVTGINWEKVQLTLSTATPTNGSTAPLLSTWFLRYREPIMLQRKALQNSYMVKEEDFMVGCSAAANADALPEMAVAPAPTLFNDHIDMTDNQMNVTYTIDLPYSIPGNGKEQSIDLREQELTADYSYYTVPKLSETTFLMAHVKDADRLNLLSGDANVNFEGTYIGETPIDASNVDEALSLTLGTDKRVSVKREQLQEFSSKETLSNAIKQTFTYQTTVKNNQQKPIQITIKDQYPVSTQKDIEVELTKNTTPPTVNDTDKGIVTWKTELQPGESKQFKISYRIKYPKDKKLNL